MRRIIFLAFFLASLGFLSSCQNEYKKALKGQDYELKEKKARELFAKKKWARALPLFDEVLTVNVGKFKAEDLTYHIAYCYFGMQDFLLANYYFVLYSTSFPSSAKREEADYMAAYCLYMESPRESLDQTNTEDAIRTMQNFVNRYPNSERVKKATELIEELLGKLELKSYKQGYLYYNLGYYNSSTIVFQSLLRRFPDTKRRAEVGYMLVKSSYLFGINSVKRLQKERLQSCVDIYNKNADKFEGSEYEPGALDYKTKAETAIKELVRKENIILAEEAYLTLKARYKEAQKSPDEIKVDRFLGVISYYKDNLSKFAGSNYEDDAAAIHEKAKADILKMENKP